MTENKQKQTKITFRYKVITKQNIRRNKPWVGACAHARWLRFDWRGSQGGEMGLKGERLKSKVDLLRREEFHNTGFYGITREILGRAHLNSTKRKTI